MGYSCFFGFTFFAHFSVCFYFIRTSDLVSLVTFFFLFCAATPLAVLYVALYSSWLAFLWKLYRSSLFVRLPALKICAQFIDCCVLWLAGFGGYCLLLLFCRGVLLIILSAFATVLLFSEKSLPFAACFLHFVTTCLATTAHSLTAIMSLPWNR